jgi:putative transposase
VKFEFIDAEKTRYPVRLLCRVLEVSRSGFYAWKSRPPSARSKEDESLSAKVLQIFHASRQTYGSPRIKAELNDDGHDVGRRRVSRLMAAHGLQAVCPRRFCVTTDSNHDRPIAENILDRDFAPEAPNQSWAGDITYIWTGEGWLYLAVVLDLFSRRVIGWSMADNMETPLVSRALQTAIGQRLPGDDLIHHSDRGGQYASDDYQDILKRNQITGSMSRRGNCWDNAVVESFFGTLKNELIYRKPWPTRESAHQAVAEYIELFYNIRRRHSFLGQQSPRDYEIAYGDSIKEAA